MDFHAQLSTFAESEIKIIEIIDLTIDTPPSSNRNTTTSSSRKILVPKTPEIIDLTTPPSSPPKPASRRLPAHAPPVQVPGLSLLETERKDKRKREIDEEAGGEKDIAREQEKKKRKIHHSPLRLSISKIGCKPRRREEGGFWGQYIWGWDGDFESEKYGERTEIVIETETETEAFPLLDEEYAMSLIQEMERKTDFQVKK